MGGRPRGPGARGAGFGGLMGLRRGLGGCAELARLEEILWRRGWRATRLTKVLGDNAMGFFAKAEGPDAGVPASNRGGPTC